MHYTKQTSFHGIVTFNHIITIITEIHFTSADEGMRVIWCCVQWILPVFCNGRIIIDILHTLFFTINWTI